MNIAIGSPRVLLIGLGVICFILIFWYTHKKTALPVFQFATFLPKKSAPKIIFFVYRFLIISVIAGGFFVLSGPQRKEINQQIKKSGIDIVIALDVSYSMEATDLTPNRLDSAKRALQQFLATRVSDRVGLVIFAGKPFTGIPLTFDYSIFEEILSRIATTTINQQAPHLQGTAIGDALLSSITLLDKAHDPTDTIRERIIVLFTDGEANVGVDPKVVAELASEKHIQIYSIGIGSVEGGTITTPTAFGIRQQRVNGVDEATLRTLAEQTNGKYARAVDDNSLKAIVEDIAQLTRTEAEREQYTLFHDARRPFVIALRIGMLLVMLIDRKVLV